MKLDYKKVLRENLPEGAFSIITSNEKEFADWIDRVKRQSVRCDELFDELKKYNALENQCIAENQCGLRELLLKWKEFFDDIAELYDYRKAEEQGLLLRLPCKEGDTVWQIHTMQKSNRKIIAAVVADAFFIALCVLEGRFGKTVFLTREEAESALAEKGGVE